MRYLAALIPFAVVVTLSGQALPVPPPLLGQAAPPPPWDAPHLQFDVASVKANTAGPMASMMMRTLPTSFTMSNLPLRILILQAYRLQGYQLVGGPSWIDSERFDIVAKAPEGSRLDQTMLMLRGLLAERFKLKVRGETRDTQVYALKLARSDGKLGPKLSKTTIDCAAILAERREAARANGPGPIRIEPPGPNEKPVCTTNMRPVSVPNGMPLMNLIASGQPLQLLVSQISSRLNAQVVDRTGLTGLYDFELQFAMMQAPLTTQTQAALSPGGAPTAPLDDGPTIHDAVRELGLKLETERGPVEHLVIDSVERPTEN